VTAAIEAALGQRYRLDREIGQGGMATVYQARDLKHGRKVAVKVFRPELARSIGVDRFLREIQVAAQLQHPHIVALIDSGEADGVLYYLMPLVEGETLRARLERVGRLAVDETIRITREVADALGYAHRRGIVHRDIKPENILLADGHAFVTDFGIARALDSSANQLTRTGFALGTPTYMAPEQASGDQPVDGRADLYALASVVYELLVGRPPFTGPTQQAVLVKRFTESAPRLRATRPDAPEWLDELVLRSLAREPDDRPATVDLFAAGLAGPAAAPGPERDVWTPGGAVTPSQLAATTTSGPSIVVLPFTNLSPEPENDYFGDGLTDEVISDLSQVKALRVIARASSSRLKGTTKDLRTIGQELNVRYALTGTVRRTGDALRITAELMETASSNLTWSEKYGGTLADVFDLQARLSRQIVAALEVALTPDESRLMAAHPEMSLPAYESYLRARQEIMSFSAEGLERALKLVDRALEIAPRNALLHATRGYIFAQYSMLSLSPPFDPLERAGECVRTVFELDQSSSLGFFVRGYVSYRSGRTQEAVADFKRALTLDPGNADALFSLAYVYGMSGRNREARRVHGRLVAVDPLTPANHWLGGWLSCYDGNFEDSAEASRQWVQDDPSNGFVRGGLVWSLLLAGEIDRAREEMERVREQAPGTLFTDSLLFLTYATLGDEPRALGVLRPGLLEAAKEDESLPISLAGGFAMLGDRDRAFEWLRVALGRGSTSHRFFERSPGFGRIRTDPEFGAFLAEVRARSDAFQV
jgi:serine/threonine protein kinase/Flp pilus assembly protein TadD